MRRFLTPLFYLGQENMRVLAAFLDMLALGLILLKFSGFLTWPWLVVLMPIWVPILYFTGVYLVYKIFEYIDNRKHFEKNS